MRHLAVGRGPQHAVVTLAVIQHRDAAGHHATTGDGLRLEPVDALAGLHRLRHLTRIHGEAGGEHLGQHDQIGCDIAAIGAQDQASGIQLLKPSGQEAGRNCANAPADIYVFYLGYTYSGLKIQTL